MARPMPLPQNADNWWDKKDSTVGEGEDGYEYLFYRRIILQLEIKSLAICSKCGTSGHEPPLKRYRRRCDACKKRLSEKEAVDRIKDARCWFDSDEGTADEMKQFSTRVAQQITGKTLTEVIGMTFNEFGDLDAGFVRNSVHMAIKDWARKFGGRESRLPKMPESK